MSHLGVSVLQISGGVVTGALAVIWYLKFKTAPNRERMMSHEAKGAFKLVKEDFKDIWEDKQSKEICRLNISKVEGRLDSIDKAQHTMSEDIKEILKGINKE